MPTTQAGSFKKVLKVRGAGDSTIRLNDSNWLAEVRLPVPVKQAGQPLRKVFADNEEGKQAAIAWVKEQYKIRTQSEPPPEPEPGHKLG